MGIIISRFRKEKTTFQLLEALEENIKDIEQYTISTQERRKRFVARFLVTSIGLYVFSSLVFYFVFFPPTWNERIVYSVPLLICPIIIFVLKRLLAWHYERKVLRNSNKLKDLRTEKKKILEKVMEKETYKVAVEILDKFGDRSHRLQTQALNAAITPLRAAPLNSPKPLSGGQPVQRLPVPNTAQRQVSPPSFAAAGRAPAPVTPQMRPGGRPMPGTPQTAPGLIMRHQQQQHLMSGGQTMAYRRTPFPIINHNQKGVLEKMVDYLVGDGPVNRFAMICTECFMHNGMALKEEYEFTAFRCAFCGTFNAAKKQRPSAPRLPFEQAQFDKLSRKPESSTASEAEGEEGDRSSASSESGEPRSPGVGEEGPVEAELELVQQEEAQQLNPTGEGDADPEPAEKGDIVEEMTDAKTAPSEPASSLAAAEAVPSRPETVGSKKLD